jgi:chromate transporter
VFLPESENPRSLPRTSAQGYHCGNESQSRQIPFREALHFWIKLGFISFGGPTGQIAMMHRELVERRRWLSNERFLHALNYCMLLPGPEAQQLAIYIGWLMHRTWGGIVAGAFFVIPSIFVLLGLSFTYALYGNLAVVAAVLDGFKPVVVAIVVEAVIRIGNRALKRGVHFLFAALAFAAIYFFHIVFPLIILTAGCLGLLASRVWAAAFAAVDSRNKKPESPAGNSRSTGGLLPVVIDDHVPPPPHTVPSRSRAMRVLCVGVVLWLAPFVSLVAWRGRNSLHTFQYLYFTKAALVTFGGAYAVLAYVTQAAVGNFGWISRTQAVDGLALAETTPGPLIMVLQFVGFMAGWNHPQALAPSASAVIGALVTTYTTFLPCFLFIFLGGPYIEVLRGNRGLSGALSGITAAVVGVVLNLALVFGATVIWPDGIGGKINGFAVVLSIAAFVALYRLKVGVQWVVLAGGLIGLVWTAFVRY